MDREKVAAILEEIAGLTRAERELLLGRLGAALLGEEPAEEIILDPPEPALGYGVHLCEVGRNRGSVMKAMKEIGGFAPAQVRELVENVPVLLKAGVGWEEANTIRRQLEGLGAKVFLEVEE